MYDYKILSKEHFTPYQSIGFQVHYRKVHHYNDETMPVIQKVNLDEVVNPSKNHVAPSSEDSSSTQSGEFNIQGRSSNSFVPSLMQPNNQPNLSMSYEMDPNNINMF